MTLTIDPCCQNATNEVIRKPLRCKGLFRMPVENYCIKPMSQIPTWQFPVIVRAFSSIRPLR